MQSNGPNKIGAITRLNRELDMYKLAFPTCDAHKPRGGARGNCLLCGVKALSAALSQIDYALGEPNEMRVSMYDVDCNEDRVVKATQAFREKANELARCLEADIALLGSIQCMAVDSKNFNRIRVEIQVMIKRHRAAIDAAK
jgi:hypothetical protein